MTTRESSALDGLAPLVAAYRGDGLERLHVGVVALVDSDARPLGSVGDVDRSFYLRSAAKPFQLLPLIESGAADRFGFTDDELAVMAGSHSGEADHRRVVESILGRAELDRDLLMCGTHPPFHRDTARQLVCDGARHDVLHNNCSGKHAGMLALARHIGAPFDGYTEPDHPVQKLCLEAIAACCDWPADRIGIGRDGCTVPAYSLPLRHTALGYARLMAEGDGSPRGAALRRIAAAMIGHPRLVAGTDRLCTETMTAFAGSIVVKIGAAGFIAGGFRRDGRGVGLALKVADGDNGDGRAAAFFETLHQAGGFAADAIDALRRRHVPAVQTLREQEAGRIVPLFRLARPNHA